MAREARRRCRCGEGRGEDVGARKAQRLVFFFYIPETAEAWQLPRFFRLFGLAGRD